VPFMRIALAQRAIELRPVLPPPIQPRSTTATFVT
jgi:hypothetical protein